MRSVLKRGAALMFLAAACLLPVSAPAVASSTTTPCWQLVMNQWYQGEIKSIFPLDCYHEAIKHLPTDISVYSSARQDITAALQAAISYDARLKAATQTTATTPSGGATTTTTPPAKPKIPIIKTHGPGSGGNGAIPSAINSASPGGSTSFPLPLLILGGLAILLVAAGGIGLLIRRRQGPGAGPGPA
jgi:hypothetical protein